jgi:hypothetical protein
LVWPRIRPGQPRCRQCLAPFAAGKLVEHYNAHVPFLLGAGTVVAGALVLATVHRPGATIDDRASCPIGNSGPLPIIAADSLRSLPSHKTPRK